ncbi:hypothetical protein Q0O45_13365, partial [Staphylococcus aureus]|nr:hypothetical protein [Staphylococcus aureus]
MSTETGHKSILFLGNESDRSYLPYLKPYIGTHKCYILLKAVSTFYEIESYCKERGITGVITTREDVLLKVA